MQGSYVLWMLLLAGAVGGGAYLVHQKFAAGQGEAEGQGAGPGPGGGTASVFKPGLVGYDTGGADIACRPLREGYTEQECRQECADDVECVAYNVNGPPGGKWCCQKTAEAVQMYGGKPVPSDMGEQIVWYGKQAHWS